MSTFTMAVIVTIAALLTFTTTTFVIGPLVDKFQGEMNEKITVSWDGTATYHGAMQDAVGYFSYFYTILTFFCYVYVVWLFKVIIYKTEYSTEGENGF